MKLPPEDGLLTVDQPPTVNPDFFSDGAGAGPVPGVVVAMTEFWVVDRADHRGDGAEFHPSSLSGLWQLFLSLPFLLPPPFDCLLGISLGSLPRLHLLASDLMVVGIRIVMFVIPSNVLEPFFAQ